VDDASILEVTFINVAAKNVNCISSDSGPHTTSYPLGIADKAARATNCWG